MSSAVRPVQSVAAMFVVVLSLSVVAFTPGAWALPAGTTSLLSAPGPPGALPPSVGQAVTGDENLSGDGCRTAFVSGADALVPDDDDRFTQIIVRDSCANTTFLASRASGAAGAPANADCGGAAISDDGNAVAFQCAATNLHPDDTDSPPDVFVRDIAAATTTLVSRATGAGGSKGNGGSDSPTLDEDGSHIAFQSSATNLAGGEGATSDVFLRDLDAATTILISRASQAGAAADAFSGGASVDDDGSHVAYTSIATNLDPADTDADADVFVRDVGSGDTILASREAGAGPSGNGSSGAASLNADASFVAFQTGATNLSGTTGGIQAVRKALPAGALVLASTGGGVTGSVGIAPTISDDGARVAFSSDSVLLDPGATTATRHVYVRDVAGVTTTLADRRTGVAGTIGGASAFSAISDDGTAVSFRTERGGLTPEGAFDSNQAYRRVLGAATTDLVSRPTGAGPFQDTGTASARVGRDSLSSDGRMAAFLSGSNALSPEDDDAVVNAFVRDTVTGQVTLVSRASGAGGAPADRSVDDVAISGDGRRVAFLSQAGNLGDGDADTGGQDVFVRDLLTAQTFLVTRADGPGGVVEDGSISDMSIDGDGSRVAFTSDAPNLGEAGSLPRVWLRDLAAGTTRLMSRAGGVSGVPATDTSQSAAISDDGGTVAFESFDPALTPDPDPALRQVFVRDVTGAVTELVSRADGAGAPGEVDSARPALDADGSRVLFLSGAAFDAADTAVADDVYLRDRATARTILVSRASDGTPANGQSTPAGLSDDGAQAAFTSLASNLGGTAPGGARLGYVRDIPAGTTDLVTRADGVAGGLVVVSSASGANTVALSGNGQCLGFNAAGRGVIGALADDLPQAYLRSLGTDCAPASPIVPPVPVTPAVGPAAAPAAAPVPAPGRGTARLVTRSVRADAKGRLALRLSCPAGRGTCAGTLVVTAKAPSTRRPKGSAARPVTLASARFSVAGGGSATVRPRLTKAGRSLLARARGGRVKATARIVATGVPGGAGRVSGPLTVLARRR